MIVVLEGKKKGRGNHKWVVLAEWRDDLSFTPDHSFDWILSQYVLRKRLRNYDD